MDDCVILDWTFTWLITVLCIVIYVRQIEIVLAQPVQAFIALAFLFYAASFVYLSILVDVVDAAWANWMITFLVLLALYAIAYFVNKEFIAVGLVMLMITNGIPIYLSILVPVMTGAAVVWFTASRKIENLGHMIADAVLLSANIACGAVAVFSNWRDANAPDACVSKHINMIMVCDESCGSILTNGEVNQLPKWWWLVVVGVIALIRIFIIYATKICNRPTAVTQQQKKEQKSLGICWFCCHWQPDRAGYAPASARVRALENAGRKAPKGAAMEQEAEDEGEELDEQQMAELEKRFEIEVAAAAPPAEAKRVVAVAEEAKKADEDALV